MKKALTIVALAALMLTSGLEVAHAQSRGQRTYGPQQGGWSCPWMGQGAGSGQGSGWNRNYGCGWNGRGQGYGPGYTSNGRGNSGQYGSNQRTR